jgi:hypothetical protein
VPIEEFDRDRGEGVRLVPLLRGALALLLDLGIDLPLD